MEAMKEKETNVKLKCQTCGEMFNLRENDHPRWTLWCPICRTLKSNQASGYRWVGGGEVGW